MIQRPADEVWNVVSDAGALSEWFPGIDESSATETSRSCRMGDVALEEDIVTNDPDLRRFQYRITSGLPVEEHLATVDVIESGDGCIVVYGTDVKPDEMAAMIGPAIAGGVEGLKSACESS